MSFKVKLQPQAKADLDAILARIKERSPSGAASWYRAWTDARKLLARQADIYSVAPEDEDHEILIQQILFRTRRGNHYRAVFTVVDGTAHVLHIRGQGQDSIPQAELHPPNE